MNILLYGGGLDSSVLLVHLVKLGVDFELMHVDYGQKARDRERKACLHFADKYHLPHYFGTLDLSFSQAKIMRGAGVSSASDVSSNKLELRNLALIGYACSRVASLSETGSVYLGFHQEPDDGPFLDARTSYLSTLETAIGAATACHVGIVTPFAHMTRQRIIDYGSGIDPEILTHSYTCYEERVCGECSHCKTKQLLTGDNL